MKKNILILEDNENLMSQLVDGLSMKGKYNYNIFEACSISEGKKHINQLQHNIHCYIIDLNMRTVGLSSENENLSKFGKISGWFFLNEFVFRSSDNIKHKKKILNNVIFYTAYKESFKKYYESCEYTFVKKIEFNELIVVDKGKDREMNKMIRSVDEIIKYASK